MKGVPVDEREYMAEVMRTYAGSDGVLDMLCLGALGLAGETGEVVDIIKKTVYQGHALYVGGVAEELGDVLWYVALICNAVGLSFEQVMALNVRKLRERYPDGFDPGRSVGR